MLSRGILVGGTWGQISTLNITYEKIAAVSEKRRYGDKEKRRKSEGRFLITN